MRDDQLKSLRAIRDVQATDGNWDVNGYMLGMYNGLELALAILEDRKPEYRFHPGEKATEIKTWDDDDTDAVPEPIVSTRSREALGPDTSHSWRTDE